MLRTVKSKLYFIVARYFRLWAAIKLRRWNPRVIVITGSAGKTTALHLAEAQLADRAHYSHNANSSFGIPFDILGLPHNIGNKWQWLIMAGKAPLAAFSKVYDQKLYVAEVDADRPREGEFLAELLKPAVTLWVSALHTHVSQYESSVGQGAEKFETAEAAVAYEYGHLLAATKELVVIDGDNGLMRDQLHRTKAKAVEITQSMLSRYELKPAGTIFQFDSKTYSLPALLPRITYCQLAMVDVLLSHLAVSPDHDYKGYRSPPGRSSVFAGIRQTTLIDSTYNNSNLTSLEGVIDLLADYPAGHKWLVVGDMFEQGSHERREHQKLAEVLNDTSFDRLVLEGPRIAKYTLPLISPELKKSCEVTWCEGPKGVLDHIQANLQGGEAILFKGLRCFEGVIEHLLADPKDADKLVRRGPARDKMRREWGL